MCFHNTASCSCYPYMSKLIQGVVGEFHLEEGHGLLHPVGSRGGGVRMDVGSTRGLGLCLACYFPLLIIPLQKMGEEGGLGVKPWASMMSSMSGFYIIFLCTRNKTSF